MLCQQDLAELEDEAQAKQDHQSVVGSVESKSEDTAETKIKVDDDDCQKSSEIQLSSKA